MPSQPRSPSSLENARSLELIQLFSSTSRPAAPLAATSSASRRNASSSGAQAKSTRGEPTSPCRSADVVGSPWSAAVAPTVAAVRAIVLEEHGGPEVLRLGDAPD